MQPLLFSKAQRSEDLPLISATGWTAHALFCSASTARGTDAADTVSPHLCDHHPPRRSGFRPRFCVASRRLGYLPSAGAR